MRIRGRRHSGLNYGWVMVLITFAMTGLCFGGFSLVSVFIKPLSQDFGWLRGEIAIAYTVATIGTAIFGVVGGRVTDLYGVRTLAIVGAVTMAVCLALLSQIHSLWQLYILFAIFGALGHGAIYVPLTASLTNWFVSNRGLAVGIASAGNTLGLGVMPLAASTIIADAGWRDAFLYLGIGYLVVALPIVFFVRDPPIQSAISRTGSSFPARDESLVIRPTEALMWVCSAAIFCCVCMSVPMIHVPSLASDLGLTLETATSVLTVLMLAGTVGRMLFGYIADRAGPLQTYILASLGQTIFVYWFVSASSLTEFYIVAAGFGLCFGGVMTNVVLTIRSLVPTRIAGTSIALAMLFAWLGMGTGGFVGGLLFDWSGNYTASFSGAAIAGIVNLAILLSLFVRLRRTTRYATA